MKTKIYIATNDLPEGFVANEYVAAIQTEFSEATVIADDQALETTYSGDEPENFSDRLKNAGDRYNDSL